MVAARSAIVSVLLFPVVTPRLMVFEPMTRVLPEVSRSPAEPPTGRASVPKIVESALPAAVGVPVSDKEVAMLVPKTASSALPAAEVVFCRDSTVPALFSTAWILLVPEPVSSVLLM